MNLPIISLITFFPLAGGLGWLALQLNAQQKLYTIVLLGVIIGGMLLWLNMATYWLKKPDQDSG